MVFLQTGLGITIAFTRSWVRVVCQFSSTITSVTLPSGDLRIISPLPCLLYIKKKYSLGQKNAISCGSMAKESNMTLMAHSRVIKGVEVHPLN